LALKSRRMVFNAGAIDCLGRCRCGHAPQQHRTGYQSSCRLQAHVESVSKGSSCD
jgi:hypothetical protein